VAELIHAFLPGVEQLEFMSPVPLLFHVRNGIQAEQLSEIRDCSKIPGGSERPELWIAAKLTENRPEFLPEVCVMRDDHFNFVNHHQQSETRKKPVGTHAKRRHELRIRFVPVRKFTQVAGY